LATPAASSSRAALVHEIDDLDLSGFTRVAANFGTSRFGVVVTPNVDHVIRLHEDPAFRAHYQKADIVLMDSQFLAYVLRVMKRVRLHVCTGSDATLAILSKVTDPSDRIVLIGGSPEQARELAAQYGLTNFHHFDPPMGFIRDANAVEECLQFIERHSPFRFCFLAIGSPQQEMIAQLLRSRGTAQGLALCIGASINFLTGRERRAPRWMQQLALEWLYRLVRDPRRLAGRYLVRGPRVFRHLLRARVVPRRSARSLSSARSGSTDVMMN
jgi:exopolysaccharide biosynthesis WecB/TagA/CpsF family protein